MNGSSDQQTERFIAWASADIRGFKNIKELLITELCIITSDKAVQVIELSVCK